MDSSSDDEAVISHRKSSSKRIFDSDDDMDDTAAEKVTEATEDFKLHLSDEEDEEDDVTNTMTDANHDRLNEGPSVSPTHSNSDDSQTAAIKGLGHEESSRDGIKNVSGLKMNEISEESSGAMDIMKRLSALADSDSESDVDGDLKPISKSIHNKSKISSKGVIDSDSDSKSCPSDNNMSGGENEVRPKKEKSGPERKSKTKAKDAMLEIKAESQRQLRQSKIGLPYHVPKQRSLLDFLNRRKSSSPMPIKSSAEQLATVWKQIEEREKEAEEFYKSESEHDSASDDEHNEGEKVEDKNDGNSKMEINDKVDEQCKTPSCENDSGTSAVNNADCGPDANSMLADTCLTKDKSDEAVNEEVVREESMTTSSPAIKENGVGTVNATEPESNLNLDSGVLVSSETMEAVSTALEIQAAPLGSSSVSPTTNKALSPNAQDSQDISLHLSEPQGTEANECSNSDTNADHPNGMPDSKKSGVVKSATESKAWSELNNAMKCLDDDDSELEDVPSGEAMSKDKTLKPIPRLSLKGDPNGVIDLDDIDASSSVVRTPGVKGLIERFMKHSASKKTPQAQTVELSLISSEKDTSGGVVSVKQESLKIVLTGDDNPRSENITPGARLKLLKSELNRQMRKQKEEEWLKKQEEMKNEEVFQGEKDDCGMLLDEDDEEEDMTESETESEPEIDDVRETKKKKKTSEKMFADEEAEVEDDDDANADDEDEDEDEDEDDAGAGEAENDDCSDDDDSENIDSKKSKMDGNSINKCKADLSNREDQDEDTCFPTVGSLKRTMTNASSVSDLFASQPYEWRDEDDDEIPAAQPNGVLHDKPLSQAKEKTIVFSPISLSIPGRGNSFMDPDLDVTPTKLPWTIDAKSQSQSGIKTLFSEPEPSSTQEKFDELVGLFGGKFNGGIADLANTSGTAESESDLMALCSGKFVTQPPQPEDLEGDSEKAPSSLVGSQFSSQTPDAEPSQVSTELADESVDFSLKWDEDTKKSDSLDDNLKEATNKFRLEIMSSDEEDVDAVKQQKKKKNRNRKLEFSDDEDDDGLKNDVDDLESEESEDADEEAPKKDSAKLFGVFSKQPKEVFYDSDENEIEPADFLDKEAELSEEEDWRGSDDEDEKGLDQLEMNEADKEDIDQDLVREQLVKNHMQKMLDEDRRDVRILQEMLLEDGELHSENGGRERQFRWRNVDSTGMGDDERRSDDEQAEPEDDEDDAEWRKKRHEREMFLKEQREKQKNEGGAADDDDDEVLKKSELLQLGKSVLFKSRSSSMDMSSAKEHQQPKLTVQNQLLSPDGKKSSLLLSKRGSFLSRGDSVLAKLAKLTGSAKENVLAGAKTSGNFVFSAISPTKKESQLQDDSDSKTAKRKASMGLANPSEKKFCLSASGRKGSGLFDHL
ncbi:hypothetical protein ONE63_006912 [Megalurothrips usitatus]|uniref:Claspin-like n=1 Tax=Megalurothrips usitatus TaxID=439358 RepID=A0AAV7XSW6_9NEOP|nr:hypothetical protein ONE63_006912 [Megalurothrips usitatus]